MNDKESAKKYLERGIVLDKEIKYKQEEIQRLKSIQTNTSAMLSNCKVKSSPKFDKFGEVTVNIFEMIEEYKIDILNLIKIKKEIKDLISVVPDYNMKLFLELKYVFNKKTKEISKIMNYSVRQIIRNQDKAIEYISEVYSQKFKISE